MLLTERPQTDSGVILWGRSVILYAALNKLVLWPSKSIFFFTYKKGYYKLTDANLKNRNKSLLFTKRLLINHIRDDFSIRFDFKPTYDI